MIEYMCSGTPFLSSKLEGIPIEYYDYIYTIDQLSKDSVANKFREILAKDENELIS